MEFYINGNKWEIAYLRSDHPIFRKNDGSYTIGVCNNNTKCIFLNENLRKGMLKKVLTHEVAHAYMFEFHIDLSNDQEELICDLISTYGDDIIGTSNDLFGRLQKSRKVF